MKPTLKSPPKEEVTAIQLSGRNARAEIPASLKCERKKIIYKFYANVIEHSLLPLSYNSSNRHAHFG